MPRPPRLLLSRSFYHIMTRGNNKNVVFKNDDDFRYFLGLIYKYKLQHPFDLYHYCLMPNHVHMMIKTRHARDFSVFIKKLNLAYFHHYRQKYGWIGHFWQDRFKSKPIGKDQYFIQCGKYIELNPVRKKIVNKPEEYQYSSYRYYALGKANDLITPDFIFEKTANDNDGREFKYRQLDISEEIKKAIIGNIWGIGKQKYREQDKINRKLK